MLQFALSLVLITSAFAERPSPCAPELGTSIAQTSARAAEAELRRRGFGKRAVAYGLLIGAMVSSAAATTYLTAQLPPNFQFLSQLIGQVSALGVYVFGAPIWEPLSSAFRKLAFGIEEGAVPRHPDHRHITQWHRTQKFYSLNEQMGRNIAPSFLSACLQMFYEARRAMREADVGYAVGQVAAAAVALRLHYADLPPDDSGVALAIRESFTAHVSADASFRQLVERRIAALDAGAEDSAALQHYAATLDAWLTESR